MEREDGWFTEELAIGLGRDIASRLRVQLSESKTLPTLRLSRMGPICPCSLWHSIHAPGEAEPLPPWAKIKYSYGHILEALVICLAKAAGHQVEGEQDELIVDGIKGHRDCVIDGNIVDVKSASSRSFVKFRDGSIETDDPFGYLDQLDGYVVGSLNDPLVRNKDSGYILGIDKQLGHMVLYEHRARPDHIHQRIREHKEIVSLQSAPRCNCETIADGKSGNVRLGVKASYSAFKYACFPKLRTFLYADGPRYLSKVVRVPDVTEIDRYGKRVYN